VPELYTQLKCFWIVGFQSFFLTNNAMITMMVALDRLKFSLQPKKPIPEKLHLSCLSIFMLIMPFIISSVIYVAILWNHGESSTVILYCSTRAASAIFWPWALLFAFSFVTLVMYVTMLIAVQCVAAHVDQSDGDQGANSVAVLELKMFKRLSRNMAITTIFYFFLGPLPNGLSTVFASVMPDQLLSVGIYYSWLAFVEGSMYTFTLLLTHQFRQEMGKMFGFKPLQQ